MFGSKSETSAEAAAAPKAHLPSGSSFYYDKDLKKWVNKVAGPSSGHEKVLEPPPIIASPGPPASSAPAAGAHPGKISNRAVPSSSARSARSRYVDVMNPGVVSESQPVATPFMQPKQNNAPTMVTIK